MCPLRCRYCPSRRGLPAHNSMPGRFPCHCRGLPKNPDSPLSICPVSEAESWRSKTRRTTRKGSRPTGGHSPDLLFQRAAKARLLRLPPDPPFRAAMPIHLSLQPAPVQAGDFRCRPRGPSGIRAPRDWPRRGSAGTGCGAWGAGSRGTADGAATCATCC